MTQMMLSDHDLDIIFRKARSYKAWLGKPVSEITIRAMYDLLRWGPTSFNCSPARFVIVQSEAAKKKLAECVMDSNKSQVTTAPFTVIVGQDGAFYEKLPALFKAYPNAKDIFAKDKKLGAKLIEDTAFRNSSLQGGYMIIAARSLGLDCCPMSGFDVDGVNEAFFKDSTVRANFICSMGYGAPENMGPRDHRLSFDEACEIV